MSLFWLVLDFYPVWEYCWEVPIFSFLNVSNGSDKQTWLSSAFPQKFRGLHVWIFQNKIPRRLRDSYVHVFDSLHSNIWCNIRVPEGYFVTKYKNLPGALSNVVALQKFAIYWKIGLKSVYFEAEIIVLLYKLEVWDSKFWRIVSFPANIYLLNNGNTRKRCQDPKFKIKTSSKWATY